MNMIEKRKNVIDLSRRYAKLLECDEVGLASYWIMVDELGTELKNALVDFLKEDSLITISLESKYEKS